MAENYPKSKLKRRKPSVEKPHPEISSRDTPKRDRPTLFGRAWTAEADGSVVPAAAWWNRARLPAVESLWAFTLKSALPYLENQHWDLVPDLPHPSAAKPTALKLDEQWLCDLREEVAPLPEPAPPSLRTSSSPDPLRLSFSQQDNSVRTKPAPHTPDRQLSSHRQSHHGKTAALPALTEKQLPSLHSWEEAASSTSVGGGEQEEEAGPVNRQVKVCDNQAPLQREGENKEEVAKDKEEEQVQGSVRGDGGTAGGGGAGGGGGLQSCPMCLLVFPVGFTQMDCDGHLAQCLSEMNVDMTW